MNGTVDIAGPEAFPLDEPIRTYLAARNDPRPVVTDPNALYFGAKLNELTLVPHGEARLGAMRFKDWLARSQSAADSADSRAKSTNTWSFVLSGSANLGRPRENRSPYSVSGNDMSIRSFATVLDVSTVRGSARVPRVPVCHRLEMDPCAIAHGTDIQAVERNLSSGNAEDLATTH